MPKCRKCDGVMGYYRASSNSPKVYICMRCDKCPNQVYELVGMDFTSTMEYLPNDAQVPLAKTECKQKNEQKCCVDEKNRISKNSRCVVAVANKPGETVVAGGQFAFNFTKNSS